MKYLEKVKEYLNLSEIKDPTTEQSQAFASLRRELSARGLDPQHTTGLLQRVLVYDHRKIVLNYLALCDAKKDVKREKARLNNLGITTNPKELRRILAGFKTCAREIDRKKTPEHVNIARADTYAEWDRIDANTEDDDEDTAEEDADVQQNMAFGT